MLGPQQGLTNPNLLALHQDRGALSQVVSSQPKEDGPALITRHSLREEQECLRILLAEDNLVNQTLAIVRLRAAPRRQGYAPHRTRSPLSADWGQPLSP